MSIGAYQYDDSDIPDEEAERTSVLVWTRNRLVTERARAEAAELQLSQEQFMRHAAEAEVERLRKELARVTTCDCGLPLSVGKCGICDNDD